MKNNLEIIDPLSTPKWDDLVLSGTQYCFFHSSAWARVLHETYGFKPIYYIIKNQDGLDFLLPVMETSGLAAKKRGVSLPFSDYCRPIIDDNIDINSVMRLVYHNMKENRWVYLETRDAEAIYRDNHYSCYYTHTLDLFRDQSEIKKNISTSVKRNIKKAISSGITAESYTDYKALEAFFKLHCLTRKRLGVPIQPFRFFNNIYKYIIQQNLGLIILARWEDKFISGAVYFHYGKQALYKFGASNMKYQHLRGNDLVMMNAIEHYMNNDYHTFSFGRTAVGNEGLRRFKNKWGVQENIIRYYRYNLIKNNYKKHSGHNEMIFRFTKYLPVPVLRLIGNGLYKYMA